MTSAKIVTNAKTPGAKCYGFVTMMSSEDATKCISQLNHTELHGRMIQVEKAKGEPGGPSRNKTSTRKPSDSKKDVSSDKKKEGEKGDGDKKDTSSSKKEGPDDKTGKEGEKKDEKRSQSRDASRSSKEHDRRMAKSGRSFERPEHRGDAYKMGHQRSGRHEIMEERERQRMRARERIMREEERRRREDEVRQRNIERRQREEAERLQREREKLRMEREKIERQKHELLRLEREHQRMEREKLEREREELRRQQMSNQLRYEETRRSIKRPADDRDRREFFEDRKRPAPDSRSRFESSSAPQRSRNYDRNEPPARFDHNHGNYGTHGSHGGGRDDTRGPGGVGGGSRYEDRREMRERDDRRPVERSGPRDDRDHRGPMPSQGSRDRPRDRWASSSMSVSDVLRGNMSHQPQPGMGSMSMAMMAQNDRFAMSNFRKY